MLRFSLETSDKMRESISNGECIDHGKRRFLRTADKYQAMGSRAEPVSHTSRSE